MATGLDDDCPSRERLSALADGEVDVAGSAAACASWHGEVEARRDWHAWQLIGDVLRSDELASDAGHDARFLAAVRGRLADEPVVLAPAPLVATARRPMRWQLPAAAAAGFMLVIGTFVVVRPGQAPVDAGAPVASAEGAAKTPSPFVVADLRQPTQAGEAVVASPKMIRDAHLERYLVAHKQFAGTTALGAPSAFLRSATVESAAR